MKLDTADKIVLTLGCICTCFWFFESYNNFPVWKVMLMTLASIGYLYTASKLWIAEKK